MVSRDEITRSLHSPAPVDWYVSGGLVPYPDALSGMDEVVAGIAQGEVRERVWLLEHPPLYTAGTSANPADLVSPERFPVFATG
ncbi:MAG: lipoyl(octanoyl) transferase LipB, partial [Aestuariivirga sp.]